MSGRPYTTKELERLRAMTREGKTAAECAEALGRSESSIHQSRARYGMARRTIANRSIPALREDIRKRHALGWSDLDIAERWNVDRHTVGQHRRAMGLPSNAHNDRHREKTRRAFRRQMHLDGVGYLGSYRHMEWRRQAVELGWPPECLPNEVKILEALATGPKSTSELAAVLGRSHWKRIPLKDGGNGTYTGRLMRRGLVRRAGQRKPRGKGRGEAVYALAPGVERERLRDQPEPTERIEPLAEVASLERVGGSVPLPAGGAE